MWIKCCNRISCLIQCFLQQTNNTTKQPVFQSWRQCPEKWRWHQVTMTWQSWWHCWFESQTSWRPQTSPGRCLTVDIRLDRWSRSRWTVQHQGTSRLCTEDQSTEETSYEDIVLTTHTHTHTSRTCIVLAISANISTHHTVLTLASLGYIVVTDSMNLASVSFM